MLRAADDELGNVRLLEHAVSLTAPRGRHRVCYLPTALGDAEDAVASQRERFAADIPEADLPVLTLLPQPRVPNVRRLLLPQDLLLVQRGSLANLMAV